MHTRELKITFHVKERLRSTGTGCGFGCIQLSRLVEARLWGNPQFFQPARGLKQTFRRLPGSPFKVWTSLITLTNNSLQYGRDLVLFPVADRINNNKWGSSVFCWKLVVYVRVLHF